MMESIIRASFIVAQEAAKNVSIVCDKVLPETAKALNEWLDDMYIILFIWIACLHEPL